MSRVALLAVALVLLGAVAIGPPAGEPDREAGLAAAHTVTPPSSPGEPTNRSRLAARRVVEDAMIVNGNPDALPPGCPALAGERAVTIRAGRRYAEPGEMFGFDTDRIAVAPCTRLAVTVVNEDAVRHQWMVHGLPTETYPMGMFSIEVTGPGSATGTFVTPAAPGSYLVHCSLPQHEQKGMLAALVVGDRSTAEATRTAETAALAPGRLGVVALAAAGLALLVPVLARRYP